jgi:hypothetical protein
MYAVEVDYLTKFFKRDPLSVMKTNPAQLVMNPEGTVGMAVIFRNMADVPDTLPYFEVSLYSLTEIGMQDIFLSAGDDVHATQALTTYNHVLKESLDRRPVRAGAVEKFETFRDFKDKFMKAQEQLESAEAERLRQMELGADGREASSADIIQSASRFAPRRLESAAASSGPAAAPAAKAAFGARSFKRAGSRPGGGGGSERTPTKAAGGKRQRVSAEGGLLAGASAAAAAELGGGGGASVVGSTDAPTPVRSGMLESASVIGVASPPAASADLHTARLACLGNDEKLKQLLTSTHGKMFPGIMEILDGCMIKRELSGVWRLAASSTWLAVRLLQQAA